MPDFQKKSSSSSSGRPLNSRKGWRLLRRLQNGFESKETTFGSRLANDFDSQGRGFNHRLGNLHACMILFSLSVSTPR